MGRLIILALIPVALLLYALVDCIVDDEVERTSVPKVVWVIIIVLVFPYVGALAWLIVAKIAKPRRKRPPRRSAPLRPVAPDDDPDFLRGLADQQHLKDRKRKHGGKDSAT
ncbi:MAG: PLDc N-terminal domain-containing protein [Micrococcales bacterium]|nr:PLDc N-terminal domain-containing protein [Micrococcales bacterium]